MTQVPMDAVLSEIKEPDPAGTTLSTGWNTNLFGLATVPSKTSIDIMRISRIGGTGDWGRLPGGCDGTEAAAKKP
ncbi:hypothetical protein GCM10009624_29450 [Gordonia sinesedis]